MLGVFTLGDDTEPDTETKKTTTKMCTHDVLLFGVRPYVLGQVIAAHELFAAFGTLEPLLAGVRAPVPLQLVRSSETFAALRPRADERTFT